MNNNENLRDAARNETGGVLVRNWEKRGNEATIEEIVARNLGISDISETQKWVSDFYCKALPVPNLSAAAALLRQRKGKHVTIVGDYDADGVTSTSILVLSLRSLGYDVSYRIPKRFSEGYGLNPVIIDEISSGLVITVDNGIAADEAVKKAKDKGLNVIILDHHLPKKDEYGDIVLPPADIIVDNWVNGGAGFVPYCGAGVSLRFAMELGISDELLRMLIPYAAIGTVADVVELRSENWAIVHEGLSIIESHHGLTPGLEALLSTMYLYDTISAEDIGFRIAPVLNAQSRMEDAGAERAVELLTAETREQALPIATLMVAVNERRKDARFLANAEAEKEILENGYADDCPIILHIENIGDGIIGLVAGTIAEEYHRPCICFTNTADGVLKGSGRAGSDKYNLKNHLDQCQQWLLGYGGHAGAAGLSLKAENLDAFMRAMQEASKDFVPESADTLFYDLSIKEEAVPEMVSRLSAYEPFGQGNPPVVFRITDFTVIPAGGKYRSVFQQAPDGTFQSVKYQGQFASALGFGLANKLTDVYRNVEFIGTLSAGDPPSVQISDVRPVEKSHVLVTPMMAMLQKIAAGK